MEPADDGDGDTRTRPRVSRKVGEVRIWFDIIDLPTNYSDSDATTVSIPGNDYRLEREAWNYRTKLADWWMDYTGQAELGKRYVFDKLPRAYFIASKLRRRSARRDFFLFGHPSGKTFRSPNEFWEHFGWLMKHGTDAEADECACKHSPCARP